MGPRCNRCWLRAPVGGAPELGYEWDFFAGLLLRPRLGVLFYAQSPQSGRKPVNVGGLAYDHPTHTWIDAYITLDLGYEFEL